MSLLKLCFFCRCIWIPLLAEGRVFIYNRACTLTLCQVGCCIMIIFYDTCQRYTYLRVHALNETKTALVSRSSWTLPLLLTPHASLFFHSGVLLDTVLSPKCILLAITKTSDPVTCFVSPPTPALVSGSHTQALGRIPLPLPEHEHRALRVRHAREPDRCVLPRHRPHRGR